MSTQRFRSLILALAVVSGSSAPAAQGAITPPVRTVEVKPVYTRQAAMARVTGDVTVAFDVLPDGTTANFTIVKSLDDTFGLDQQAIEALKQWRFKPANKDGAPVTARVTATLRFVLRDRDGTVYGAPPVPPAQSAWPDSFANEIIEPGATWKPDSVKLGDTTLHFESPAGWIVRNFPQGSLLLGMTSADGRRVVMTGAAHKMPSRIMLPLPPQGVLGFGKVMAALPALQKAPIRASGQVQIGTRWWLWLEMTPSPDMLNEMPPELRKALGDQHFSEMNLWSFVTGQDDELVQILMYDWLPDPGSDRDAELSGATSTFRVILSKMTLSKERPFALSAR